MSIYTSSYKVIGMNSIKPNKVTKGVPFDPDTIEKCNKYASEHGLSFSAAVRLIVNDFFLKLGGA